MGFLDKLMTKIDGALGRGASAPARTSCEPCPPCPKCGTPRTNVGAKKLPREARAWLQGNANANPFAGNAFHGRGDVLAFVNRLYAAGAKKVTVAGVLDEPWRIASEGGPYADTLRVVVPGPRKQRVMAVVDSAPPDRKTWKGNTLRLWWD